MPLTRWHNEIREPDRHIPCMCCFVVSACSKPLISFQCWGIVQQVNEMSRPRVVVLYPSKESGLPYSLSDPRFKICCFEVMHNDPVQWMEMRSTVQKKMEYSKIILTWPFLSLCMCVCLLGCCSADPAIWCGEDPQADWVRRVGDTGR